MGRRCLAVISFFLRERMPLSLRPSMFAICKSSFTSNCSHVGGAHIWLISRMQLVKLLSYFSQNLYYSTWITQEQQVGSTYSTCMTFFTVREWNYSIWTHPQRFGKTKVRPKLSRSPHIYTDNSLFIWLNFASMLRLRTLWAYHYRMLSNHIWLWMSQ